MNANEPPTARVVTVRPTAQQEFLLKETLQEILEPCAPHQRALLGVLALAHQQGFDLASLLRSLAEEMPFRYSGYVDRLVWQVEAGVSAIEGVEMVPELLPPTSVLALRLAHEDGSLPRLYAHVLQRNLESELNEIGPGDSSYSKIGRLGIRSLTIFILVMFFSLKILPEFKTMFDEFDTELPTSMLLLMRFGDLLMKFWFIVPLLLLLVMPFWFRWFSRLFQRMNPLTWRRPRIHPEVARRRSLALVTQSEIPIARGIKMITDCLSAGRYFRRWSRANTRVETGQNRWEALAEERIVTRGEAEALKLTDAADTQAWLLRWMAANRQQRRLTQSTFWMRALMAVVHVVLGAIVVLICVAVFSTLITVMASFS